MAGMAAGKEHKSSRTFQMELGGYSQGESALLFPFAANSKWRLKSPGQTQQLAALFFGGGPGVLGRFSPQLLVVACSPALMFTECFQSQALG